MRKHALIVCIYEEYYSFFAIVLDLNKNKLSTDVK